MADLLSDRVLLSEVVEGAEAMALLAGNEEAFRGGVDAFRARDGESMQSLLARHGLGERCEAVCHWLRSKECVLLCLELSGLPSVEEEPPDVREFAEVVAKLADEVETLQEIVIAIEERDPEAWSALIAREKLEPFSHLLCHWACTVYFRLVCGVVCEPSVAVQPELLAELRSAGAAVGRLAADERSFALSAEAVGNGNCEELRARLEDVELTGVSQLVCEWFCSWHCLLRCLSLCRVLALELPERPIDEMLEFARAAGAIAAQGAIERLSGAVLRGDAERLQRLAVELEFERYCLQFAHWVCFLHCQRFCVCVVPNPALQPWFTNVGYFDVETNIDPVTGETNTGLPYPELSHSGGPNFAFYGALELRGWCPATYAGEPMRYRFLYDDGSGPVPITGGAVSPVEAGTRTISWPEKLADGLAGAKLVSTFQTVMIAGTTKSEPPAPAPGTPWQGPAAHVIVPDGNGWVEVDGEVFGEGFATLLGFNTPEVVTGKPALSAVAGTPVASADQRKGTVLSIVFQALRAKGVIAEPKAPVPDFHNELAKILINNWLEVNALNFVEFGSGECCTPINDALGVEFTVDHEQMDAGEWSLGITSCSKSAPGKIAPTAAVPGTPPRGGAGIVSEDTASWETCSYTATLSTRPGLTTGLSDREAIDNSSTFCISGH